MQAFKKFLFQELLFTAIISLAAFILFRTLLSEYYISVFWLLLGIIAFLTAIFHYSVLQIQEKLASRFTHRFMMFTGVKMIIYLAFITTYAFMFPEKAKVFLLAFLALYLLYTVFEVILIIRFLKKK